VPFISLGVMNRVVREEGEWWPVVEVFNDFGYGESKRWGGIDSVQKRRMVRQRLISSVQKAGVAWCRVRRCCGQKTVMRGRRGPRWARLGRTDERTRCADGLAREEFSKENRQAARWFGSKTKKEEMGCRIRNLNLI
jgi:hypothetical protein